MNIFIVISICVAPVLTASTKSSPGGEGGGGGFSDRVRSAEASNNFELFGV